MILCLERHILEFLDDKMTTIIMDEIELNLGDAKEGDEIVFGQYIEPDVEFYDSIGQRPAHFCKLNGYARLGKPIRQNGHLVTWKLETIRPFIFIRSLVVNPFQDLFDCRFAYMVLDRKPLLKRIIEKECEKNAALEFRIAYEVLDEFNSLESLSIALGFYQVNLYNFRREEEYLLQEFKKCKFYPQLESLDEAMLEDEDDLPF